MKKKIYLMAITTMFLNMLIVIPVNAKTFVELPENNFNKVQLLDDVIQDKKFINEADKYMMENYGIHYQDKLVRNQTAVDYAYAIESTFKKNKLGESVYPSYIGGLYVNSDDGLVIQVVKSNVPNIQSIEYKNYEEILKIDKNATIQNVDYSYEELKEIHDIILDKYLGKVDNIIGLYIDVPSNSVVVELENYSSEEVSKIKNVIIDSPMVSFVKGVTFENVSSINPGSGYTSSTGKACSYGYRAKTSSGQVGIVSAGHCFTRTGNTVANVGTVTMHSNNGTLDASFIATNSGVTPTNTLAEYLPNLSSNKIGTKVLSDTFLTSGASIAKAGYKTGYTFGSISVVNYSYSANGITYTNLIRATLVVNNGDSGGIVVRTYNTGGVFSNDTLGILKAKSPDGKEALITKASLINSKFKLSRY